MNTTALNKWTAPECENLLLFQKRLPMLVCASMLVAPMRLDQLQMKRHCLAEQNQVKSEHHACSQLSMVKPVTPPSSPAALRLTPVGVCSFRNPDFQ